MNAGSASQASRSNAHFVPSNLGFDASSSITNDSSIGAEQELIDGIKRDLAQVSNKLTRRSVERYLKSGDYKGAREALDSHLANCANLAANTSFGPSQEAAPAHVPQAPLQALLAQSQQIPRYVYDHRIDPQFNFDFMNKLESPLRLQGRVGNYTGGLFPADSFVVFNLNDERAAQRHRGDKVHVSVDPAQMDLAVNVLLQSLAHQDVIRQFKLTDMRSVGTRINDPDPEVAAGARRVHDGAQCTIYIHPDQEGGTYSAQQLCRVADVLRVVQQALTTAGVRTGQRPVSDIGISANMPHLSYRNDERSDRQGGGVQNNANTAVGSFLLNARRD